MLDETELLLQLEDIEVSLELAKLIEQHLKLLEDVGELQDELHDEELFDRQLDDSLQQDFVDEQLELLLLLEKSLEDELRKLLEQQGLSKDDVGELSEELLDKELFEGLLEEKLLLCSLDDKLKLLQLQSTLLKLELMLLLEEQGLEHDDDG